MVSHNYAEEKSGYRTDIQALRGLAVLLVVLYHAGVPALPAGYLGVDIFFVISGFLITGIITRDISNNTFSFLNFYFRRAKRLLPAAYVVIACTVILALLLVTAPVFKELGKQVLGAVTFSANFVLMNQAGYFDGAADTKPLLHFWSLAVEEQYYLIMPALLYFVPRRAWFAAIAAVTLASTVTCLIQSSSNPDAAFYLLPSRAWQLGLGSLTALITTHPTLRQMISFVRIPVFLVIVGVAAYPLGEAQPGLGAAIACLATLVIIIGHSNDWLEQCAPVRALAWVGNISYSLYLVHWPILVFTRAMWLEVPPIGAVVAAVILSFVLAWVLYNFVEQPFRLRRITTRSPFITGLAMTSVVIAALPWLSADLFSPKTDYTKLRRQNYGLARNCAFDAKFKWTGRLPKMCQTSTSPKVLVIGDSYAMVWTSALKSKLSKVGLAQATHSACDPLLGMARYPKVATGRYNQNYARGCMAFYQSMVEYISKTPTLETVVLAGRFSTIVSGSSLMLLGLGKGAKSEEVSPDLAATGIANLVKAIRAAGKKVVVIAPPPADGSEIGDCLERVASGKPTFGLDHGCDMAKADVHAYREDTIRTLETVAKIADVTVINPEGYFCDNNICRASENGTILYRDAGHLTVQGAELIGEITALAEEVVKAAR